MIRQPQLKQFLLKPMSKVISSIFTSLDGFAADANGDISWFRPTDQFFEYSSLVIQNSDTAIYGRKTFDMMDQYWPTAAQEPDAGQHEIEHGNWYNQSRKIVFSKTLTDSKSPKTIFLGANSIQEFKKIKADSSKDLVIFGSPTVVGLLTEHNLIDEYYIFIAPIILGGGQKLFNNTHNMKKLNLLDSKQLSDGSMMLHYSK